MWPPPPILQDITTGFCGFPTISHSIQNILILLVSFGQPVSMFQNVGDLIYFISQYSISNLRVKIAFIGMHFLILFFVVDS